MSNKYPYLNSVIIKDDSKGESENNKEFSSCDSINKAEHDMSSLQIKACSFNISDFDWNLSDSKTNEINLDLNYSDTVNISKENNSSFPKKILSISSISSLSSLASTSDLSYGKAWVENALPSTNDSHPVVSSQHKPGLLNHITKLFGRDKSHPISVESSVKSSTCLILNDRPSGLPPKDPEEVKRHNAEYIKLINKIKRKEQQKCHEKKARERSKRDNEERQYELTNVWKNVIIPSWVHQRSCKLVRHLWWEGIPTSVRDKVWLMCIPNIVNLTVTHYDNFLAQMLERIERYTEPETKAAVTPSNAAAYDIYISETTAAPDPLLCHKRSSGRFSMSDYESTTTVARPAVTVNPGEEGDARNRPVTNGQAAGTVVLRESQKTAEPQKASQQRCTESELRQTLLDTIKRDVSRTFPQLNLFQEGGPHHDSLHRLLGAYACYRPDIGYVQGMSFLAAVLTLIMHPPAAFLCFANILEMPCHHAFYNLDETQFLVYFETFKVLLVTFLPQLSQHFVSHRLELNIFLCDWLFTIFSRALPLETALRVWDLFCRDGEVALFRAGLGILRCYEVQLLASDFEEMAGFLTGAMPESLTPAILVEQMQAIKLSRKQFNATIIDVKSQISTIRKRISSNYNNSK